MKSFTLALVLGLLSFSAFAGSGSSCKVKTTENEAFDRLLTKKGYEIVENQSEANISLLLDVEVQEIQAFTFNFDVKIVISSILDSSRKIELNGEDTKFRPLTIYTARGLDYYALSFANREIPKCEHLELN